MDNLGILVQAILSLKDTKASKDQIASELPKLESQLQSDKNTRVKIVAGLDIAKSKNLIQSQLNTLANQAKAPTIKIGVDTNGLNSVQGATQNITNNLKSVQTQAQQTANSIHEISTQMDNFKFPVVTMRDKDGNTITDTVKTLQNARDMFSKLGFTNVKFTWADEAGGVFDRLTAKVTDSYGAVQNFKFALLQGSNDYTYDGAFGTDSGVEKLIQSMQKAQDKLKALRTDLASTLKSVGNGYSDPNAVKPIVDDTHLKNLNTQYVHALRSIADLKNADDTTMASMKANAESEIEKLKQMVKQYQNAEYAATSLRTKDIGTIKTNQTNELNEFIAQVNSSKVPIDTMTKDIDELKTALNGIGDKDSLTKFLNQFDNAKSKFESVKATYQSIADKIKELQRIQNSGTFNKNSSDPAVINLKQQITALLTEYEKLKTQLNGNVTPQGITDIGNKLTQLNAQFNDATTTAKRFETELRSDNGAEQLAQKVKLLNERIKAYQSANPKAAKAFSQEFSDMSKTLSNPNIDLSSYNSVAKQLQIIKVRANEANLAGKTMWATFKEKLAKFTGWMSMTAAVSMFTRSIRDALDELKEVDTILTEISKTSDRTEESLRKLGETSFATASKYGQKASDYLLGVQEMSRAGFDENSSEQMAELSTLAQSAGDMTAELANEYLIATNAGYQFGGSAEKLNAVLNSQNYITNRNALNMSELAEATKIVASQAAQSGIGIDEMTAAVGTMIATTQQGGEVAARALKGILMNLQAVKGTAEDIGDGGEDITDESLTKYEEACVDLGVALKEVKNGVLQLRDPMVILEELANAVSKEAEGSIKVANLVSAIGGKYRGGQLLSLLRNWDTYSKMLSEFNSNEAVGSAFDEAMKSAESWEGKLNELSNTWTDFVNGLVTSDTAKSVIDFLTTIIKNIDKLRDSIGTIPTLLGSIATVGAFKNVGGLINTPPYAPLQLCA